MCSTTAFPENKPPYIAILLSEPTMVTTELYTENIEAHEFATAMACKSSSSRRDTWDDKESAFEWLSKKRPWKSWDSRALRLFTVRLDYCSDAIVHFFAGIWLKTISGWRRYS